MFNFITSPEFIKSIPKIPQEQHRSSINRTKNIQIQIAKIINNMPSPQLCRQAALNAGLPPIILEFDKIIKKTEN